MKKLPFVLPPRQPDPSHTSPGPAPEDQEQKTGVVVSPDAFASRRSEVGLGEWEKETLRLWRKNGLLKD
jgi:hypothetical protein